MRKLPLKLKKSPNKIVIGHFCVFTKHLLKASAVVEKLYKMDEKNDGIPAYGFIHHDHEKIYWCKYGFVNDASIYQSPGGNKMFPRAKYLTKSEMNLL